MGGGAEQRNGHQYYRTFLSCSAFVTERICIGLPSEASEVLERITFLREKNAASAANIIALAPLRCRSGCKDPFSLKVEALVT